MVYTSKGTQKKIDTVRELSGKVAKAKSIVLADYRGLKHKQLEELRKALKKSDAEFTVTKNTLLKRALSDPDVTSGESKGLLELLTGSTAALFAYADEVAPLKELMKFFKAAGAGITKGGLLGTHILSEADVIRLSALPTRQVLLGQLVGQLNAPIQGLHSALNWNINKLVWVLNKVKSNKK